MDFDQITQILWIVLGLALAWIVLRFIFRLARKVFACGCAVIVALGIVLILVQYLRNLS